MMKLNSKLWIFLLLYVILALSACQPVCQECPQITCPTTKCPDTQKINSPSEDLLSVHFFNVGQGDSILIKYKETEMLIDCGKNTAGPEIVEELRELGVGELEYLMVTHPDSDHLGGCDNILQSITTHTVITNGKQADTSSYDEFIAEIDTEQRIIARESDKWKIGPATISVVQVKKDSEDSNQNSIVSRLVYNKVSFLFTGDCDNECEDSLLPKNITSDILKVAHHGSKFGTEIDFLEKVDPQLAVISVGTNSYGHPSQEVLDRLSQEGVVLYRTDLDGDIIITTTGQEYEKA